jgi:hypothetical protein
MNAEWQQAARQKGRKGRRRVRPLLPFCLAACCLLLVIAGAMPYLHAETGPVGKISPRAVAARSDPAPPWAVGSSWTWTADQAVDFCITVAVSIRITSVTGTITDRLEEITVFNGTPVYRVEGSYAETLKGYILMPPLPPSPVSIPIIGNTTVYYRDPDLAAVRQIGHFTINMGALGSATIDSITDASPPFENIRFPLDLPKTWAAGSDLTVWTKMTSASSGYETTTHQRLDCNASTGSAMEDVLVPAGTFSSYNITLVGTATSDGSTQPYESYMLYSPVVTNQPVRAVEPLGGMTVMFGLSACILNHAPVVADPVLNVSFPEDTVGTMDLGTVFSDPDPGDILAFCASNMSALSVTTDSAGHVLFTPPRDWSGTEWVLFCATDRKGASSRAEVRVKVLPVNDAPVLLRALPGIIMEEDTVNGSLDLSDYFTDVDYAYGDRLTFSFGGNGSIATGISPAGIVTLRPLENWSGLQNITMTAEDDGDATANATLRVVVLNAPDSPGAVCSTADFQMLEDTSLFIDISKRFWDPDIPYGDILAFSVGDIPPGFFAGIDNRTGELNITPPRDYNGRGDIDFIASDRNGQNATERARITVIPVNDPPQMIAVVPANESLTMLENSSSDLTVLAIDVDSSPLNMTWRLDGDEKATGNNFTYSADFDAAGRHNLTVVISDGEHNVSWTWNLTVRNVNRPPTGVHILSPANRTRVGHGKAVNFSAEGSDPDGDNLTFCWKTSQGKVLGVGRSIQQMTLPAGKHTITLEVSDGNSTIRESVELTVVAPPATSRTPNLGPPAIFACIALWALLRVRQRTF